MPIDRPDDATRRCGAVISLPGSRRARRRMFRRLNYCSVPGLAPVCGDTNDPDTVQCGFLKRLFRATPDPDPEMLARFAQFVSNYLKEHVPAVKRMTFEDWLAGTSYNDQRKNQLRAAYADLRGGRPTRRQASHIDTFVKTESYPEYKHVRMINSRSDAFKVFTGPLFKAIEEVVYADSSFIKHVPVPHRPALIAAWRKAGLRFFATDFTAYESHFSPELMQACECQLYRHCLPWCGDVDFICSVLCGENRMRTRSGVSASIKGRRMSGDMCTSLGNGFTNVMLARFLASEQGQDLFGFVEGDDGLFATKAELRAEDYAKLGFTIKIEEVEDIRAASFCGMVFGESNQIIRDPVAFLATFGWTSSFTMGGERLMDELLRAKALSTVYETPHCPIVGALARYALSVTRHVTPRFVTDGYHSLPPRDESRLTAFAPTAETRALFERLYGISPTMQLAIEKRILSGNMNVLDLLPPARTAVYQHYADRYVELG